VENYSGDFSKKEKHLEPHTSFGTQFGTSEFCRLILPQHVPKTKKKSNLQDFRSTTNVAATSSSKFFFVFVFVLKE